MAVVLIVVAIALDVPRSVAFHVRLWALGSTAASTIEDAAAPDRASADPRPGEREALLHYHYRGTRFVRVPIDDAELAGAGRLDASCVFSTVGPVREANLKALVASQVRSRTVAAVADALRVTRRKLRLDDDEYLELIARFVQEIPYGTVDREVRLPVEVIASGEGVCDDKSVLLAALLLHEGYDTAIWAFDSQAHAAVGVRCSGPGTFGNGYAFIEPTRVAFVGDASGSLGTRAAWRRNPDMTRLGGTRVYGSDSEAAFLVDAQRKARSTARSLKPYIRALASGPDHWHETYRAAVARRSEAEQLAMLIEDSMDERRSAYEMLSSR